MGQYLIDSNVTSNYFSELYPIAAMKFIASVMNDGPNISIITEIEALFWKDQDGDKEAIVADFVNDCNIVSISPAIVVRCVALRRNRKIKTPDAIIAATAIVHKLKLISGDGDFKNIVDLQVVNPFGL